MDVSNNMVQINGFWFPTPQDCLKRSLVFSFQQQQVPSLSRRTEMPTSKRRPTSRSRRKASATSQLGSPTTSCHIPSSTLGQRSAVWQSSHPRLPLGHWFHEIGRASCRERV